MPHVTEHEDGTVTFSVNSSELRACREFLESNLPVVGTIVRIADGPEMRATVRFVKSVLG